MLLELVTNLEFESPQKFDGIDNLYITLTTTPPRLCSSDFEKTIQSLLDQTVSVQKVIINVPYEYRRSFGEGFDAQTIDDRVNHLTSKYSKLFFIRNDVDYGPATKLLGVFNENAGFFDDESVLIVVDDDIEYADTMVWSHLVAHTLYQCGVSAVDQRHLVQVWEPYKFHKHHELFVEDNSLQIYGFLSFAFRFKYCREMLAYFRKTWDCVENSFFHDDAVFSAYIKRFSIYSIRVNVPSIKTHGRLEIDGAAGFALREIAESGHNQRLAIEQGVKQFVANDDSTEPLYLIPSINASKSLRNVQNIKFLNQGRDLHFMATYVNGRSFLLTVTYFGKISDGKSVDVFIDINGETYRICLNISKNKTSYLVAASNDIFESTLINTYSEVFQTAISEEVSKFRLYSACSVIGQNLGGTYKFFNDSDVQVFMARHASKILNYAYGLIKPGAYKADIFRYLYLYVNGGVYVDCKALLSMPVSCLSTYDDESLGACFVADQIEGHIYISLLAFRRSSSEILKMALSVVCFNIVNRLYNSDFLSITGPGIFREVFGLRPSPDVKLRNVRLNNSNDWQESGVVDNGGQIILINSYSGYYDELGYLDKGHYSVMYNDNNVFHGGNEINYSAWAKRVFRGLDKIAWINLDRSPARRERMEGMLKQVPVTSERISAFDGKGDLPVESEGLSTKYEVGCLLSHLAAIKNLSNASGDTFLVLEDDMELAFLPLLRGIDVIDSIVSRAPDDWEVILISWIFNKPMSADYVDWLEAFKSGPEGHVAGTGAYLINRKGIEKINSKIPELTTANVHASGTVPHSDGRRLIADVYLYSNLKSYVYSTRLFKAVAVDSFINEGDIDWHTKTQTILLNQMPINFP